MTRQQGPLPPEEEREPTIDPHDPKRSDKWGYTDDEIVEVIPDLKRPRLEEADTDEEEPEIAPMDPSRADKKS
jgi:hypothetical protein